MNLPVSYNSSVHSLLVRGCAADIGAPASVLFGGEGKRKLVF